MVKGDIHVRRVCWRSAAPQRICLVFFCLVPILLLAASWSQQRDLNFRPSPLTCGRDHAGMKNIMLIFGTRPEAIKLAPVIKELRKSTVFKTTVVSTGQHKQMLEQVLLQFDLKGAVDYDLNLMKPGQTLSDLSVRVINALDQVMRIECPDLLLVQGDTTTAFTGALAAYYLRIPVGHVEAGLRTRNIYSPFPEEVNRQAISAIASYNFAPTNLAADNLRAEGRTCNVYITGNTVVDALLTLKNEPPSSRVLEVSEVIKSRQEAVSSPKTILLTAHRRENLGEPLTRIFSAISTLLKEHDDIVVVYPIHLNPEVRTTAVKYFGTEIFSRLRRNLPQLDSSNITHLDRLLIVPPVDHSDLVALIQHSFFILTDSGGIQEEAITLGKPVLILRDTTERPEGILAGASHLVGSREDTIVEWSNLLLKDSRMYDKMSNSKFLFGDGSAARQIVHLLEHADLVKVKSGSQCSRDVSEQHPKLPEADAELKCHMRTRADCKRQLPEEVSSSGRNPHNDTAQHVEVEYDIVVVVTVWKRNTVAELLKMISTQTALYQRCVAVILFQNGEHVNISAVVHQWSQPSAWGNISVGIKHVVSKVETGYYGRFASPLFVRSSSAARFILLDDDIIFGDRYFENMLRVVDDGFLATRNGRFLDDSYREFDWRGFWRQGDVDTFDEDDVYDFGGHIWAGRISWLRVAWQNPPPLMYNAEDFWISAVLKRELGIDTKRPRCPSPKKGGDMELCACSMMTANDHVAPNLGGSDIDEKRFTRLSAMRTIAQHYNYKNLLSMDNDAAIKMGAKHQEIPAKQFTPKPETIEKFENCLFWY